MDVTNRLISGWVRCGRSTVCAASLAIFFSLGAAMAGEVGPPSPLLNAALSANISAMKAELDAGANVNQATVLGDTPLHFILRRTSLGRMQGRIEAVALLVSHGANVNSRNRRGVTALMEAADAGDTEVVKYLVQHLATIDLSDDEGRTAISLSASRRYSDIVSFLAGAGANIEARDNHERTPLMQAIASVPVAPSDAAAHVTEEGEQLSIVELLLARGANPNTVDRKGWTPVALGAEYGSPEIVSALLRRGANVNVRTTSLGNQSPLMIAIRRNNLAMLKAFLAAKPDLSVVDSKGLTALDYAQRYQDSGMIDLLRKAGAYR